MADAPNDYRDPKVTAAPAKKTATNYIPWIIGALVLLALLAWLLGAFDNDAETVAVPANDVVVEQPATDGTVVIQPVEPVTPTN